MKGTNGSGPSTESEHCCSFKGGLRLVRGLLGCVCGCSEVEGSDDEM